MHLGLVRAGTNILVCVGLVSGWDDLPVAGVN